MKMHLVLCAKDSDLIAWKKSLQKRAFNKTVNEILSAEYKGKIASVPCKFSSTETTGEHHYRLIISDQNAYREVLEKTVLAIENCYSGGAYVNSDEVEFVLDTNADRLARVEPVTGSALVSLR